MPSVRLCGNAKLPNGCEKAFSPKISKTPISVESEMAPWMNIDVFIPVKVDVDGTARNPREYFIGLYFNVLL